MRLAEGASVRDALEASGLLQKHPGDPARPLRTSWGSMPGWSSSTPVARPRPVEIYRPLIADPKAVRKKRADEGKGREKGWAAEAAE